MLVAELCMDCHSHPRGSVCMRRVLESLLVLLARLWRRHGRRRGTRVGVALRISARLHGLPLFLPHPFYYSILFWNAICGTQNILYCA